MKNFRLSGNSITYSADQIPLDVIGDWLPISDKEIFLADKNLIRSIKIISSGPNLKYFNTNLTIGSQDHFSSHAYLINLIATSIALRMFDFDERRLSAISFATMLISVKENEIKYQTRWDMMLTRIMMGDDVNRNLNQIESKLSDDELNKITAAVIGAFEITKLIYENPNCNLATELQKKFRFYSQPDVQKVFRHLIEWTNKIHEFATDDENALIRSA